MTPWLTATEAAQALQTTPQIVYRLWRQDYFDMDHVVNLSTTDKPQLRISPLAFIGPEMSPTAPGDELTMVRINRLVDNLQADLDELKRAAIRPKAWKEG